MQAFKGTAAANGGVKRGKREAFKGSQDAWREASKAVVGELHPWKLRTERNLRLIEHPQTVQPRERQAARTVDGDLDNRTSYIEELDRFLESTHQGHRGVDRVMEAFASGTGWDDL